jgi:hypothetical protein
MIIIVVNFNRPNFLAVQIPLILKNLEPDNIHVVNTGDINSGCREIAAQYDCKYTHLEVGTSDFSKSHASALNVAYNLNKQDHEIIGILDHDCFPIEKINIKAEIDGKFFFASNQVRKGILYPNPACLFIRTSVGCIDFMPCLGMDTGGQLHTVYNFVRQMTYEAKDDYEVFAGAFLHIVKGSNWVGGRTNAARVERVFEVVKTYL